MMKGRFLPSLEDLRTLAQRTLAFGHAALDHPTPAGIDKAKRVVTGTLSSMEKRCVAELHDLVGSLERLLSALDLAEQRIAQPA